MMTDYEKDAGAATRGHVWKMSRLAAENTLEVVAVLAKRIDELEARLAAVETKPAVRYLGGHEAGKEYGEGSLVTKGGALFVAKTGTDATPGDSADWQLCVRRGGA